MGGGCYSGLGGAVHHWLGGVAALQNGSVARLSFLYSPSIVRGYGAGGVLARIGPCWPVLCGGLPGWAVPLRFRVG